jgi:PKD repeat protein
MHVASLDGESVAAKGGRWEAFLDVSIADQGDAPLGGAQVSVSWSGAATGNATASTGPDGVAAFRTGAIRTGTQVTFRVDGVSRASTTYDPSQNVGTTLTVLAPQAPNTAPTAAFVAQCTGRSCAFVDGSTDSDGTIVAWSWSFGDGSTSTTSAPSHTYAADGSYPVALTVTDDRGATGTITKTVTVPPPAAAIVLVVTGTKDKGDRIATLTWTGAASGDVYRDGQLLRTAVSSPFVDNTLGKGGGTVRYRVCAAGTQTCSAEVPVTF